MRSEIIGVAASQRWVQTSNSADCLVEALSYLHDYVPVSVFIYALLCLEHSPCSARVKEGMV